MISRGVNLAVRLFSVVCVFVLLMTSFQVMTTNASASAVDEAVVHDEQTEVPKQLTGSAYQALSPSADSSVTGVIHLAWVDVANDGNMTLCWKRSLDNGTTFSTGLTISPSFYCISDLQLVCSDDDDQDEAIVFVGQRTAGEAVVAYAVATTDGGDNWTQVTCLGPCENVTIAMHGQSVYFGMFGQSENRSVFSIIEADVNDSAFSSARPIFSMYASKSMVRFANDATGLYFAMVLYGEQRGIAFGRIGYDGLKLLA